MKWHNLKKENETSPKETCDKLTTTLANSSEKPAIYAEAVRKCIHQPHNCR